MTRRRPLKPTPKRLPARPGQWVALVGDMLTGAGYTATDARQASQATRARERSQVAYLPAEGPTILALPDLFDEVRAALPENFTDRVWLAGGAVRDALLRRPLHDLDFVVDGDALRLARRVADAVGGSFYPLDVQRETGRVVVQREGKRFFLDFARLRGARLVDDLIARDFTINAMGLPLAPESQIIDPTGGQTDLRQRTVRAVTPAALDDDAVRTIRAVRLAGELGFHIERETRRLVAAAAPALAGASVERIRDELLQCLAGPRPAGAVRALELLGLLPHCAPELAALKGIAQPPPHYEDAWEHTLSVLDRLDAVLSVLGRRHDIDAASEFALGLVASRVGRYRVQISDRLETELSVGRSRRALLFLAALLHDIAKPQTYSVETDGAIHFYRHEQLGREMAANRARALRLSNDEVSWIGRIVLHHMRPMQLQQPDSLSARSIHRFFRKTGDVGVEVCLLSLADMLAKWGPSLPQDEWAHYVERIVELLEGFFQRREEVVAPSPLVDGNDLMTALDLEPGPRIGELLAAIQEAQAVGEVVTREDALAFARKLLSDADER